MNYAKKTVFFTYNLTYLEDNSGLPTYCRMLLSNLQPSKNFVVINIDVNNSGEEKLYYKNHEVINLKAPQFLIGIEEGLKEKIKNKLEEINKERSIDQIIVHDFLFEVYITNKFLKENNIKKITFIHLLNRGLFNTLIKQDLFKNNKELKYMININYMESITIKTSDAILTNSEFTKKDLLRNYNDVINTDEIISLKLGTDKDKFSFKPSFKGKTMYFGRLEDQKGLVYLFKDIEENKDLYKENPLIVAGSGNLKKEIKNYEEQGLVNYIGDIKKKDIIENLKEVQFCLFPSVYEPWGFALNEAMAMGKVVIVQSGESGLTEQVEDGVNGFHFDFKNNSAYKFIEELKERKIDFESIRKKARENALSFKDHLKEIKKLL